MPEKKVILAVDDSAVSLAAINGVLKDMFKVYLCNSGEMALKFASKKTADLVLLDIEMPDMNGYDVIKVFKENTATRDIPVVFLTGNIDAESKNRAFELGAVDFISKPINSEVLISGVQKYLEE